MTMPQNPNAVFVKPLHDRVLIKRDLAPTHQGNVAIPVQSQRPPNTGVILAVGPKVDQVHLHAGDHVLFGNYAGVTTDGPLNEDGTPGEPLLLLTADECIAVITPASSGPGLNLTA